MPSRNTQFHPDRQPLRHHRALRLRNDRVSGPVYFLNPTSARFEPTDQLREKDEHEEERPPAPTDKKGGNLGADQMEHVWRSRDNRKGRHAIEVDYERAREAGVTLPEKTSSLRSVGRGLLRMATYYPYWDVSWLVATSFTLGSAVWVINAFFVWLPSSAPQTEFPGEVVVAGGITAFIGATIFEVGSLLLYLEAINENQTGCFGWALDAVLQQVEAEVKKPVTNVRPSQEECVHHHANPRSFLKPDGHRLHEIAENGWTTTSSKGSFRWMPSLKELWTHYLHDLGFLASAIQWIGATIFWIAGFTGLPGIINHMSPGVTNGVYWVPQIVGGSCFVLSGLLFTVETQPKWYIPAPDVLGWHVGFWNFVGGIGFTLCGALGPASSNSGVNYQATLATFWGSWAFLIGSLIQWYESLDKHPVMEKKKLPQQQHQQQQQQQHQQQA